MEVSVRLPCNGVKASKEALCRAFHCTAGQGRAASTPRRFALCRAGAAPARSAAPRRIARTRGWRLAFRATHLRWLADLRCWPGPRAVSLAWVVLGNGL